MSLETPDRARLLALARQSVEQSLTDGRLRPLADTPLSSALSEPHGSFVTLRLGEDLRGCCGSLHATRPLAEDVWRNAWASAFCDPRFMPLEPSEWPDVHL